MSTWTAESKTQSPGTDAVLLENSSYLLLEDGYKITLEQAVAGELQWTGTSANSTSWSAINKVTIRDLLGAENLYILITEGGDYIGLEQLDTTGVTWYGTNKS